jgi:hypothetical protein
MKFHGLSGVVQDTANSTRQAANGEKANGKKANVMFAVRRGTTSGQGQPGKKKSVRVRPNAYGVRLVLGL